MKNFFIIALTLTFAVSCNVKELQPNFIKAPIFYGQIENESFSKTGLSVDADGVGTILWKPSDNINVFFGTKSVKYTSNNSEEAINVSFETKDAITDIDAASNNNWGLYPYNSGAECDGLSVTTIIPNIQKCADNTFGTDLFPMIAHTTSNDLHFLNICGGIKFSLSRDDVKSITFKGNNDEDIAGKVKVSINDDGKPETSIISGEKEITITPESGTTFKQNTNYYIVMPPVVLANGFTMTFETETGVGTFIYNENPVVIKRSIFSVKEKIDTYASYKLSDNVVDMGLSVLWASCNIGATKSEEYGDYYAWGEIESKSNYNWSTYKWCKGTSTSLFKYNTDSSIGEVDNVMSLELNDDVAHVNMGGKWRLPTYYELSELQDSSNCTWEWIKYNGTNGYKVTSKKIGHTNQWIFLPAGGDKKSTGIERVGTNGFYWSSSLSSSTGRSAAELHFDTAGIKGGNSGRYFGLSVRPVYGDIIEATSISLDKTSLSLYTGDVVQLTATLIPSNCAEKGLVWKSSNTSIATVSPSGQVTAVSKGSTSISVSPINNPDVSATCFVEVASTYYDLSSNGIANCYLVNKEGDYKFSATVTEGGYKYVLDKAEAIVLWESFGDDKTPSVGDIISDVSFSNGYVLFSTHSPIKNGNAVIAAINSSSTILWSWHIWVCDGYNPTPSNQHTYKNGAGIMMDRNLGATSATVGSVYALGLLYQWGRKDPFLSGRSVSSSKRASSTLASWPIIDSKSTASIGSEKYVIQHPTTFVTGDDKNLDWYYSSSSGTDNNKGWNDPMHKGKGTFDPCPPGWMVPTGGGKYAGVWSAAFGSSSTWIYNKNWNGGIDFGSTTKKLGSGTIWYPAAGSIGNISGTLQQVGTVGYYWSHTKYQSLTGYCLLISNVNVNPMYYGSLSNGFSVRCIAEE